MGKLSVYASKCKRAEIRKFGLPGKIKRKGRPRKKKPASATRDIDTTQSYSDEDTESADEVKTHSFQFKVGGDASPKPLGAVGPGSSPSPSPSSSSTSSEEEEEEEDIWTRRFVQNCYNELTSPQFVRNLIEVLYPAKCLPDFMLLVKQLASGDFSPTNIAFLLCLERSRWESLVTTTQMRFRPVTKQFWLVVYRLLKGKGLRFLSRLKNWGQVVSEEVSKGKYDPKKSEVNFAVPDERYLQSMDRVLGRIIDPGIIDDSMKMIEGHKDIVLMADCKRVAKGLKGEFLGDVNLWGHEGNPTMKEKLAQFRDQYNFLTRLTKQLADSEDDIEVYMNLLGVLKMITEQIREVRLVEIQERRRLLNHKRCNPDPGYKTAAKSSCRAHIYECKIFVNHALELNNSICKALSLLQRNNCSFNSTRVHLESETSGDYMILSMLENTWTYMQTQNL